MSPTADARSLRATAPSVIVAGVWNAQPVNGDVPCRDTQDDVVLAQALPNDARRAEGRVPGERHLVAGREDPHGRVGRSGAARVAAGRDEGRLGQVELPGDREHRGAVEPGRVLDDGQRVAREGVVSEREDVEQAERAGHGIGQVWTGALVCMCSE